MMRGAKGIGMGELLAKRPSILIMSICSLYRIFYVGISDIACNEFTKRSTSGAWQKYPYRWRHGIIGAKKSPILPKGVSYAHCHYANPHGLPQGAADRTTTGLLGAHCAPADESPAAGTARQDSFSAGDGSQPVPR